MIKEPKKPLRLIVDSDQDFLTAIRRHPKAQHLPVMVTTDWKKAQLYLADQDHSFAAIFVDPQLESGYGFSVIRFAHRFRPATPIFLIQDSKAKEPVSRNHLHQLGIHNFVKKEEDVSIFFDLPRAGGGAFDPKSAIALSKMISEEKDEEITADPTAFVPILAVNFLTGSTSFFDVFIKLPSNRYIKILKIGEFLLAGSASELSKKGSSIPLFERKRLRNSILVIAIVSVRRLIKRKVSPFIKIDLYHEPWPGNLKFPVGPRG